MDAAVQEVCSVLHGCQLAIERNALQPRFALNEE